MNSITTPESRKRSKVRSAWISFAGRIVAQIIGAVATVTLGVVVLGRHAPAAAATVASTPTVLIATAVRTHGETVIVMMPAGWVHVSGCRAGSDCVFYQEGKGKFDFKPAAEVPAGR